MRKDKNSIIPTIIIATSISFVVIVIVYLLTFNAFDQLNKDEQSRESTANALLFTGLLATAVTIGFLYANYRQQQVVISRRDDEVRNSNLDIEYNRAIDLIYRQLEINKQIYQRLSPFLSRLDNKYKNESDLPVVVNDLMTVSLNYFKMSIIVEQFLSRSKLSKSEQSYLYLLFEENVPIDVVYPLQKLNIYLDTFRINKLNIKRRRKQYENIYLRLIFSSLIKEHDLKGTSFAGMPKFEKAKYILGNLHPATTKRLVIFANLCMTTSDTLNTRQRIITNNLASII